MNNIEAHFDSVIFEKIKVILLDMDGTLYLGDKLIGEVDKTLAFLREKGKQLVFLTNNSSKDEQLYVEKLKKLGLFDPRDQVYTSGRACIEFINREHNGKKVYLMASPQVSKSFKESGVNLVEDEQPDIAVMTYDQTLTFDKIRKFDKYIKRGALYVATHPDAVCPAPDEFMPDVGSFIAMFEKSSGRLPDVITGKPYSAMGNSIMSKYGVSNEEVMMVGDRLHTDIRFANNCGFYSLLVYSGETTPNDYLNSPDSATFVLDSINCITNYISK